MKDLHLQSTIRWLAARHQCSEEKIIADAVNGWYSKELADMQGLSHFVEPICEHCGEKTYGANYHERGDCLEI